MEQLLKLQQISSISNGIFEPSAIKLDAKDCKITGSILSIEQVGDFQILNSLALVEDEIIMAEVVYPGFMRLQALEGYYLPSWPVPDCLKEFMVNLEVTICSNQSCIIQDRCLSDSFVAVQNIARQVDISLFYFDFCLEYLFWQDCIKLGKPIGNSPFKKFIKLLGICKPSVAILDGLEVFSNEWKDYDQISVKDFQYYVLSILQAAKGPSLEVCLIGICKDIKLLDPIFVSWFRRRLYLKAPNSIQLKAYLESLGNQSHGTSEMAMNTIGQSYSELYRNNLNTRNDCEDISDEFKNLDLNGGLQNLANYRNTYLSSAIETKDVRIDPVFGYKDLQDKLKRFITLPLLHPGTFTRLGIPSTKGILLYGPSGCGKTSLVRSLAKSSNLPILELKPHEIFSKYLGDSEKSIRDIFSFARTNAPCILFLDFFDVLAPRRKPSTEDSGVEERVLSSLLNEMDGVSKSCGVLVVGATSRLDEIDDAFLRPGRFDQVVLVDLPSLQDRFDIVRGVFGSMLPIEKCEVVAKGSNGWTCADICAFKRHLYFNSICVGTEARSLDLAANLVAFGK